MSDPIAAPSAELLTRTRIDLHRIAEHLLSATLQRESGHVALRPVPGGFGTPPFGPEERTLCVVGTQVEDSLSSVPHRLTTLGALAQAIGAQLGSPAPVEQWSTSCDPDEPLLVDLAAAALLADWFDLGAQALGRFGEESAADRPTPVKLWPEHFDLGITAAAVNFGASPGDDFHPEPYVYVGPHDGVPAGDDFWNAPFGAARSHAEVRSVDDALGFFRAGRERLRAGRPGPVG